MKSNPMILEAKTAYARGDQRICPIDPHDACELIAFAEGIAVNTRSNPIPSLNAAEHNYYFNSVHDALCIVWE